MDNLTNEEIRKIITDICNEEKQEHNLETDIYVITPLEDYKKMFQNKKMKLTPSHIATPILAGGAFNPQAKEVIIYFCKYQKIKKINKRLFLAIYTTYHELRHVYQSQMGDFSYEVFMMNINSGDAPNELFDYYAKHDEYYHEIDAISYALRKTKEYILNNYPEKYETLKEELEYGETRVKKGFTSHDPSDIIERYLYGLKIKLKKARKEKIDLNSVSPVLKIFLNDNLSYKSMAEIINTEDFKKLDKRIIYAFFSSETFLETLNKETLSEEQINILLESLEYTNNLYQQQAAILLEEKNTKEISGLKNIKTKLYKLRFRILDIFKIYNLAERILYDIDNKENPLRTEKQRQEHIQTISTRIEEIKEIRSQRSRKGYITINIFYILGLLLSISTIIYLLLK